MAQRMALVGLDKGCAFEKPLYDHALYPIFDARRK